MAKQTIAVDIDDVLAANAKGFIEYSNKKWGTSLTPDDYDEHWALVWGVDEREAKKRTKHIHENDPVIIKSYAHDASAKKALGILSKNYNLVIVTSRRIALQKDTLEWLSEYYSGIFSEVHFAGIWDNHQTPLEHRINATKASTLKQIGADFLIDDQPKHCIAAADAGITSILFGDYRWNRGTKLNNNMLRAKDWQEVAEYFNGPR